MKDAGTTKINDSWWGALVACVLHPLDVLIIEAMRWIEEPLSTEDFARLFDETFSRPAIARHVRRLIRLDAVEAAVSPRAPSAANVTYKLVSREAHHVI